MLPAEYSVGKNGGLGLTPPTLWNETLWPHRSPPSSVHPSSLLRLFFTDISQLFVYSFSEVIVRIHLSEQRATDQTKHSKTSKKRANLKK